MEKLDEIDRLQECALQRGNRQIPVESDSNPSRSFSDQEINCELREPNIQEHKPSDNGDPIEEPSANECVIPRKCHLDESLFPWNHPTNIHPPINPRLELTLKLKNNYALDVRVSKLAMLGFPRCPLLPDSQWNDILLD